MLPKVSRDSSRKGLLMPRQFRKNLSFLVVLLPFLTIGFCSLHVVLAGYTSKKNSAKGLPLDDQLPEPNEKSVVQDAIDLIYATQDKRKTRICYRVFSMPDISTKKVTIPNLPTTRVRV
jgi:hypothetical protein